MSYHIDGTDIVIDGWEQGISDNPFKGINDMRGVNIISTPGEASVGFAQIDYTMPSVSGAVTSADPATEVATATISGVLADRQCIVFSTSTIGGVSINTFYWISRLSNNTFSLYSDVNQSSLVNITSTGTGNFTSIDMKDITTFDKAINVGVDSNGRVWHYATPYWYFAGNDVTTTVGLQATVGNGLCYYKGYLFVFYNSRICYSAYNKTSRTFTGNWVNEWNPETGAVAVGTQTFNTVAANGYPHCSLVGQDDVMYITDWYFVDSLREVTGKVFLPSDTTTYVWAGYKPSTSTKGGALTIPAYDMATCLEELGINLLVGGTKNYIYPWDRISTSFKYPIKISESYTYQMLTVNTNTYIFAGRRGRIFVTNGSQANLFMKIPDNLRNNTVDVFYKFGGVAYNKNQIYFGLSATTNSLSNITTYRGLWAIDLTTNALRVESLHPTITANVSAICVFTNETFEPIAGSGLFIGWGNDPNYGIGGFNNLPYTTYVSYIETDRIPVGQYLNKKSFENLEFKLSLPLVSGEGIKISYRTKMNDAFTQIGETTTAGAISDIYTVNFDQTEWLQFRIDMKSTATNPSYVRLYEVRLRYYTGTSLINSNL